MKDLFKGYYRLSDENYKKLWKNATFIFDTNVLLNLYSYKSSTRDELIKIMEDHSDRIWLPHHVGLEYQRRRPDVIREQHKEYTRLRDDISPKLAEIKKQITNLQSKHHKTPDASKELFENIDSLDEEILAELRELEADCITLTSEDTIQNSIHELYSGKIGEPHKNQGELDAIFSECERRNNNDFPPGFRDADKEELFTHGGLTYQRKAGDLIIWRQIIEHSKSQKLKNIIFVTADAKEDWWWKIGGKGSTTIGARPELVDEITREAGVERFYMYSTNGFLRWAKEYLKADVSDDAIQEVELTDSISIHDKFNYEVTRAPLQTVRDKELEIAALNAVADWLSETGQVDAGLIHQSRVNGRTNFVVNVEGEGVLYDIIYVGNYWHDYAQIDIAERLARHIIDDQLFHRVKIVYVAKDFSVARALNNMIFRRSLPDMPYIDVLIGVVHYDRINGMLTEFTPVGGT